ncbi:MAG TPA: 50S ribosomal protein L6 [Patescibacteria group bacterium]|nr:50S ribosomal protein L6 [Patescibacteria group bacterium]
MSRIGIKPVPIPSQTEILLEGRSVTVKGPKGSLLLSLHPSVIVEKKEQDGGSFLIVSVLHPDEKRERALWGTTRALLNNMVQGVTTGFSKSLEVVGVGYRAQVQGSSLRLEIGFSHPIDFPLPEGIVASVEKNVVTLSGADAQVVGEVASRIRRLRKPEPYKGTGIKYVGEAIRRKAGKAGKAGAS